jgi:hypothetical protein
VNRGCRNRSLGRCNNGKLNVAVRVASEKTPSTLAHCFRCVKMKRELAKVRSAKRPPKRRKVPSHGQRTNGRNDGTLEPRLGLARDYHRDCQVHSNLRGLTNILRIPTDFSAESRLQAVLDGLAVFTVLIARFWCTKILDSRFQLCWRVSELASGLTRNQVPRKGLWVRIPCPPL